MNDLIEINGTQINVVSENDTFMVSNKQVADGFGVGLTSIQNMKNRNTKEINEGTHFVYVPNGNKEPITMWTKKGIITLGFKLKTTKKTIAFRDWASDYIIKGQNQVAPKTTMEILSLFFDGAKEQAQQIEVLKDDVVEIKTYIDEDIRTRSISFAQQKALQDIKNQRVYELGGDDKGLIWKLHNRIWSKFKKHFEIPRYNALQAVKFSAGCDYLRNMTIADLV